MYSYLKTISRAAISTRTCARSFVTVAQPHIHNEGNYAEEYQQDVVSSNLCNISSFKNCNLADALCHKEHLTLAQSDVKPHYVSPFVYSSIGVKDGTFSTLNTTLTEDVTQDSTVKYSKASKKAGIPGNQHERPNSDILLLVQDYLTNTVPYFFHRRQTYQIYTQDIVFENFYKNKAYTRRGINKYGLQLAKYRIAAHFMYANIRLQIRTTSIDADEGCIHLTWALYGLSNIESFKFWKFSVLAPKKGLDEKSDLHAGVSTYWVNSAGKIYKHRVARVIPNKTPEINEKKEMSAKLASMLNPQLKPTLTEKS